MSTDVTVTGQKNTLPDGFVVLVNNQIINRFIAWEINHSLDIVPMSFSMTYAFQDGEQNTNILSLFTKAVSTGPKVNHTGSLAVGAKVEIYLDKYKIFTGYIDSTTNGLQHGQHVLEVSGRSLCQKITDGTTIQPNAGQVPGTLTSIKQVAEWLLTAQDGTQVVDVVDLTNSTPRPLASLTNINLTTKSYDFLATLAQYEGKLLYDDRFGRLVIDDPASGAVTTLNLKDPIIKSLFRHRTNLGRFQAYTAVIDPYNAIAGVNSSAVPHVTAMDQTPSEIPDGKIMTFVSEASYPMSDASGWQTFQQNLVNVTAKRNWGRGDVISLSVVGTKNPMTKTPWAINSLIKINYGTDLEPNMSDEYVVSDLAFTLSREEHETHLILVRKEALGVVPIAITPPVAGVANPSDQSSLVPSPNQQKNGSLNVTDSPPPNAKPVQGVSS